MELNNKVALFTALAIVAALLYQTLKRTISRVKRCLGNNGQEMVKLLHKSGACCDIYLHGATVTRYVTPSESSNLERLAHGMRRWARRALAL